MRASFGNPYWTRFLVVQEVVLGKVPLVVRRDFAIPLEDVTRLVDVVFALAFARNGTSANFRQLDVLRDRGYTGIHHLYRFLKAKTTNDSTRFEWPSLVFECRLLRCKDPHDRLYALIGLSELSLARKLPMALSYMLL